MDHPPRNGQGGRRPARPWQDEPGRRTPPPRRPAPRREPADARRGGPPPRRPQPRPAQRARRNSFRGAKIALAVVSLLVMGLTGYAWAAMQGLVNGLNYANVISEGGGGDKPADGARDILLVGLDSRTDAQGNPLPREVLDELRAGDSDGELNTDSLIFVHIPNDGSKAVAISLPRDTYVDIPGGYGKHKINSAYARAMLQARKDLQKQGVTDPKELDVKANQAGAQELIKTVEKLTGSTIDNYAAVNLLGFSDITKAIGGVDVCLKNDVKDEYSGANFTKGQHTISGVEALEFVRQRHGLPNGDLDRVVRQQVFMAGMARKVLSAGTLTNPTKLSDLIDAIKKSVVLNQNWDIFGFAQQMKGLTGGQLEFRTIPVKNVEYKTPEDGVAIQVDPAEVKQFVQGVAGPQPGATSPPPAQQADPANKGTTVDVRNASGKTGLAATVAKTLEGKGFTPGDTANATARKTTVIWVPKGGKDKGQAVADALGGSPTIQEDKSVQAGHVMVFLGADYQGTSANAGSGGAATSPASQAAAPPPPEDDKPITAEGVPCVN
ncbi:LCP family protein [Amycolatopsis australiensis]|uniref:Cell envelope-related function transcriptional attenuator common domain-containing protein n=1 Tax=Amycolatopsis australiensis TaxID=546364 RepID=A0A1K1R9X3_9PSEU|nr:LCP family protein [Amycolatopsis australiensis]SFW68446.1 cell envelope-related function transcriptional attenuator common domain-containing protein [Amycolatopsis australiensis]